MPDNLEPTTTPDQHLVAATLQGDISSFGIIVERYWNMAVALARTRISDAAEAEDIAQESFIRAYSHLHKLRNPCRFAGWLTKIVIQQCVDSIRGKGCSRIVSSCETSTLEQLAPILTPGANPGLTENQRHFVRRAVSQLPQKFQKVIIMRFVAGFSTPQIAEKLGKHRGTVRVWLHRAYKMLRQELAPLLEETEQL